MSNLTPKQLLRLTSATYVVQYLSGLSELEILTNGYYKSLRLPFILNTYDLCIVFPSGILGPVKKYGNTYTVNL